MSSRPPDPFASSGQHSRTERFNFFLMIHRQNIVVEHFFHSSAEIWSITLITPWITPPLSYEQNIVPDETEKNFFIKKKKKMERFHFEKSAVSTCLLEIIESDLFLDDRHLSLIYSKS